MRRRALSRNRKFFLAGGMLLLLLSVAHASTIAAYDFTLNTASLNGHPAGPFLLVLSLTDGSGSDDGNTTVQVTALDFGGGKLLGSPGLFGGSSGSLDTQVTLSDSAFLNLYSQSFSAGTVLRLQLLITTSPEGDPTPDGITLHIIDASGIPLATLSPSGDFFLGLDIASDHDRIDVFGTDTSRSPSVGGPVSVAAPTIQFAAKPVKIAERSLLAALPSTGNPQLDGEIKKAIDGLDDALRAQFWIDDARLNRNGEQVFLEEIQSVHELTEAIPLAGPLAAQLHDVVSTLTRADREIALATLVTAQENGGEMNQLSQAQSEIASGDALGATGQFEAAIDSYRKAWTHAQASGKK